MPTRAGAVVNLANTIIGAGTLAMPYALSRSGYLLGNIILFILMLVTLYSLSLILRARDLAAAAGPHGGRTATAAAAAAAPNCYEELGRITMGTAGEIGVNCTFIFGGLGLVCSYFVFVGQLLVTATLGHVASMAEQRVAMLVAVVFGVLPLSSLRSVDSLRFTSGLAIVSMVYLASFLVFNSVTAAAGAAAESSSSSISASGSDAQADNTSSGGGVGPGFVAVCFSSQVVYTFTIMVSAFSCHISILPIYSELQKSENRSEDENSGGGGGAGAVMDRNGLRSAGSSNSLEEDEERGRGGRGGDGKVPIGLQGMMAIVTTAVSFCFAFYVIVSLASYSQFGAAVSPNVLNAFGNTTGASPGMRAGTVAAELAMAVTLIFSAPFTIWPFRSCVFSMWKIYNNNNNNNNSSTTGSRSHGEGRGGAGGGEMKKKKSGGGGGGATVSAAMSESKSPAVVSSLNPIAAAASSSSRDQYTSLGEDEGEGEDERRRLVQQKGGKKDLSSSSSSSSSSSAAAATSGSPSQETAASAEERGEEKEHDDDDEEGFDGDGDQVSDFAWYGTTTAIIMFVLGVAMFIPSVKIPLSFVGAVSGSLMVFIWPALFFLHLQTDDWLCWKNVGPVCLMVVGFASGITNLTVITMDLLDGHQRGGLTCMGQ